MNYNDKNKMNKENDDLNIQSHLNTSLELEGISVSEDLINRTLEAIKKQTAEQQTGNVSNISQKEASKKVIPWNRYIRGLAGVAAAALVIVAGYGLVSSGFASKKSDSSTNYSAKDQLNYKMAAESSSEENATLYGTADSSMADNSTSMAADSADASVPQDSFAADSTGTAVGATSADLNADESSAAGGESSASQTAPQFSITADADSTSEEDGGTSNSEGQTTDGAASLQSVQGTADRMENVIPLTFRDIFLSDPEQVQNIMVTDVASGNSITLTTTEEIDDFYSVMDKHQFTGSTETGTTSDYIIKLKSLGTDEAVYSMTVGTEIVVDYQDKEIASHSAYTAADSTLLQDLQSFYNKYNK